ncbi:MAG: 2-oxoacid:acceptor oxidoreductase subunit alpha [Deltaproteobacteria bacterium]|nr:2-oxoacid:acceptor oxidoreductase subunit alpha [Deltaproteobacteria bacterium]
MELNIRISGSAGQGMATAQDILGIVTTRSGLYAFSVNDVESRIRGGKNFSQMKISHKPIEHVDSGIDILCALSAETLSEYSTSLLPGGKIITSWEHSEAFDFNPSDICTKHGAPKAVGTAGVSFICGLLGFEKEILLQAVKENVPAKVMDSNLNIAEDSFNAAIETGIMEYRLGKSITKNNLWISGNSMLSLGCVAGGVSFMAAYPMSPATSIMTNLSQWSDLTGVVVEQSEDEISAVNMIAGAAYTGARSMTATSGGGFALMVEGVSLLGMIETPAVIVIAQRPGPATGLPTRTMQGDLRMAIHAGHGFFPKVVLAPDSVEDAFQIGRDAFDIAEKYQLPVIILTDQLLQDCYKTVDDFRPEMNNTRHILSGVDLEKIKDYKRFALTESGISSMAVPGDSRHLVVVDSDEHDEYGHLTEKPETATEMVKKRERKLATILDEAWEPQIDMLDENLPMIISWGSTVPVVKQAVEKLRDEGIKVNMMTLRWLWPLSEKMFKPLKSASKTIVVENSVSGEIESVIKEIAKTGIDLSIRKVTGRPFLMDELYAELKKGV